jgi:non-specific protein-tyrosine kinase
METSTFSEDLRRYIAILWRWAWLVMIMVVLGGATAFIISKRTVPVYVATTRLLINEAPATKNTDYASVLASERLARTYSELLKTQPVLEEVISRLGLTRGERQLSTQIEVNLLRDTQLIDVSVEDTNPVLAADIANMVVAVFSEQNQMLQASRFATSKESLSTQLAQMNEQIETTTSAIQALGETPEDKAERDRLETVLAEYSKTYSSLLQSYESVRLAEASSISNVVQVETAIPAEIPIRPRTVRNTALGMVVGLLLGVGVVFLIDVLDDTLSPEDVSRQLNLPVLGVIARHQIENGSPVVKYQPRSPVSEAFRSLRTNIQFASVDIPLRTLLITSPSPQDGKSTVAVNLGASLAQSGYKVGLVDADLRRPQIHKRLALSNREGISGMFVQDQIVLNGALRETSVENLYALTSGALPPNPAELLGSDKMSEILQKVGEKTDIILLDTPPVMAVTDSAVLAPQVDGVLLVVKPGSTKLAACRQAIDQLQRVGANILGVVLNDVEMNRSRYRYYRGYYYTYYDKYYNNGNESNVVDKDF